MLYIKMPHKDKEDHKRKRGKDKQYERFQKNGLCMLYGSSVRMRHKVYIIPILLNC